MCLGQAWAVGAGGERNPGRAFLGVVLGAGWRRMTNGRCVLRRLGNGLVACRRRWHYRHWPCCYCCFGGRRMSCDGRVDGMESDTCANGDDDDEYHHLSSPSLPSLPSRRMMGRKVKRKKMAIPRANVVAPAGTGRASGYSAVGRRAAGDSQHGWSLTTRKTRRTRCRLED